MSATRQLSSDTTPIQVLDNDTFRVLFLSANPMRLSVVDEKTATRFQVENGEERSDHIVNNAVEISIEFVLSDLDAREQFENMRQSYESNRLVTVQTRMRTYSNMLIESFPHEETVAVSTGAVLPVRLVEWREITPEYGALTQARVANPNQSSTVDRGNQRGSDAPPETARRGSILYGWFEE